MTTTRERPRVHSLDKAQRQVSVLGAGYVGLPTAMAMFAAGYDVTVIEPDARRREEITLGSPDTDPRTVAVLADARSDARFSIALGPEQLAKSDVIIICVPTPIDSDRNPDERFIREACHAVVQNARAGQVIVQTSTAGVGTTRDLLVTPIQNKGLEIGRDIFVAFSPERVDPGNTQYAIADIPRLLGGVTPACTEAAAVPMSAIAPLVHVSSPEVAELAKLHENTFRAVNIALVNELADLATGFGIDVVEVLDAADTKPYGFMRFNPGPGAGGHCIPCDPHYLLAGAQARTVSMPLTIAAMTSLAHRPVHIAERALEIIREHGTTPRRVLIVGVTYKPNVRDIRESPAIQIIEQLVSRGVDVDYYDPLVETLELSNGAQLHSTQALTQSYDGAIICTLHESVEVSDFTSRYLTIDATFRVPSTVGVSVTP